MIVAQNTTSAWYRVVTELAPAAYFEGLRQQEEADRVAGRSTWIAVEPLPAYSAFGPALRTARIRLEHVTLFGITE